MVSMVRHILFWKLRDEVREAGQAEYAEQVLSASVKTLLDIEGLRCAEIGRNLAGGPYDLIFYAEFDDMNALERFRDHPLHVAHRERCAPFVTGRMVGDLVR